MFQSRAAGSFGNGPVRASSQLDCETALGRRALSQRRLEWGRLLLIFPTMCQAGGAWIRWPLREVSTGQRRLQLAEGPGSSFHQKSVPARNGILQSPSNRVPWRPTLCATLGGELETSHGEFNPMRPANLDMQPGRQSGPERGENLAAAAAPESLTNRLGSQKKKEKAPLFRRLPSPAPPKGRRPKKPASKAFVDVALWRRCPLATLPLDEAPDDSTPDDSVPLTVNAAGAAPTDLWGRGCSPNGPLGTRVQPQRTSGDAGAAPTDLWGRGRSPNGPLGTRAQPQRTSGDVEFEMAEWTAPLATPNGPSPLFNVFPENRLLLNGTKAVATGGR
ncbi:hypothetical protein M885DRAFT_183579 [Pelagophyceae sp. CCMP2097]|nr:hypothetical protein M885DRAFT_183579 [Pelagophyceae sp. CCMP2097]